jgi:hypothetical protein
VVLDGIVFGPDGAPAVGAVVVSSAGGRAVTAVDGSYRFEVEVPIESQSLHVTAVGAGNWSLLATASVGLTAAPAITRVGPLVLALSGGCSPGWLPTFGQEPGVQVAGFIYASAVFDDGSGPALYVGGNFTSAGGITASHIARWDGSSWSVLDGMDSVVTSLTVFDDGSGPALYAGGAFTSAGGVAASRIAKWDGTSWSALGSGTNGDVRALTTFDDGSGSALYAGGPFTIAGGVSASRIAKWDGASWSALGTGMSGSLNGSGAVRALTVFDDALYAAGDFTTAGGVPANCVARERHELVGTRQRDEPRGPGSGSLRRRQRSCALRRRSLLGCGRFAGEPDREVGRLELVRARQRSRQSRECVGGLRRREWPGSPCGR